jgi:hypothetical protein
VKPYLIHAAALLWHANNDTNQIAQICKCPEHEVYNALGQIKRKAREVGRRYRA